MYLDFYNLKREPFSLSPDPRFLFLAPSHKEALAYLKYGLIQQKGFVVIIGEVGTGKTTLIYSLLAQMPKEIVTAFISNPTLTRDEFFSLLAQKYKLGDIKDKADFLVKFSGFLEDSLKKKRGVVLIIDEAHRLDPGILEEIRLLSNLETPNAKLINIILTGQPEFSQILNNPTFRALKQRVTLKYILRPLSPEETAAYIQLRLAKAGAKDVGLFTQEAMEAVFNYSNGIPRVINLLCDHALLTGFVKELKVIDDKIIKECAKELECDRAAGETSKEVLSTGSRGVSSVITKLTFVLLICLAVGGLFFLSSYFVNYKSLLEKMMELLRTGNIYG